MIRSRALAVLAVAALAALAAPTACERDRDMAESVEMPDTTEVHRALEDPERREALLDTMPGGEMARGDSLVERQLLEDKMPGADSAGRRSP